MPYLRQIQKVLPSAETVVGRVIAFHDGKHYDLGAYAGGGVVVLDSAGEKLLADIADAGKPKPQGGEGGSGGE